MAIQGKLLMHRIDKLSVKGFWGNHNFETQLYPDVTFLIGVNGTGKTTLINLVAAALVCDFRTLDKIPFKEIELVLRPLSGSKKPSIKVKKETSKSGPFSNISYEIKDQQSAKGMLFSLDDLQEQMFIRHRIPPSRRIREMHRMYTPGLMDKIDELVHVSWLSIHRTPTAPDEEDVRTFDTSIDRKIEQLVNQLLRYFSTLSKQRDDEVRKFQEYIFLSLIEEREKEFSFPSKREQVEENKEELSEIFLELHVPEEKFRPRMQKFFRQLNQSTKKIRENFGREDSDVDFEDLVFVFGLSRISNVVKLWRELQDRSNEIFAQRDKFLKILNSMLYRKNAEIGESNEIVFRSDSGKPLTPFMLSSGEKQLFILLGEVLLQRNQTSIFIADEPELSLHVTWQERLVSGLRQLNSSAQILAATHSPDIVGLLDDRAIDMESLIQ